MRPIDEMKSLYLLCFTEDTKEDADFIFDAALGRAEAVCEYENGRLIAMLFLMESQLLTKSASYPYYYLYAACTHPDYRGRGIMGRLLQRAKEVAVKRGKMGIFLKPANPPLFDFYGANGFTPFFKVSKTLLPVKELLPTLPQWDTAPTSLSIEEWHTRRKDFLNELCELYADFSLDLFVGATYGCSVLTYQNAAVVYEQREELLLIKEALCKKGAEEELFRLVRFLTDNCSAQSIELRSPANLDYIFKKGRTVPFSVIWRADGHTPDRTACPYHGFAFD